MQPFTHGKTANLRRTRRESAGRGGACSDLSFTILKKIEGDTHFSKILLIFHTESSALFERKYRFLKILKKFSDF